MAGKNHPGQKREKPVNIYEFTDYRDFIRCRYREMKSKRPSYSYRAFAAQAGLKSFNFLGLVIKNRRNLANDGIKKFAIGLDLDPLQRQYFAAMVRFNQEEKASIKQQNYDKMMRIRAKAKIRKIAASKGEREYKYFSKWYTVAIRELLHTPDFQQNAAWISQRLSPNVPIHEVKEALTTLVELDLIVQNKKGKWIQKDAAIATDPTLRSFLVIKYHQAMIELARSSMDRFKAKNREINGMTVCISRKCFEALKKDLRLFRQNVMAKVLEDKGSDEVYQINFQMFPLVALKDR